MISREAQDRFLKIIFIAGLGCAVLSALESQVDWIASFCSFWGEGCRETGKISLFHLPVPIWGIIYYLILVVSSFIAPRFLFYIVMAGVGVELTLVSMMLEMKWACLFCLANLLLVILSVALLFDHKRIWQALALSALCFMVSDHMLTTDSMKSIQEKVRAPELSVLAQVGDDMIRESEVTEPLSSRIYKLQRQIYELKKERLDFLIDRRLINLEAAEKGLSPEVHTYKVFNDDTQVSEEEVEQYIQASPGILESWKGPEQELKKRLRQYLQDQKTKNKIAEYTKPLKQKYTVRIFLEPPSLPATSVKVGASPSLGPEDAAVVVFEYSDYQCPSCRNAHGVSVKIRDRFKGKIRWVFKDYPLERHREARLMAQAARCAGEQGKFWEYQDLLYSSQDHPDVEVLKGFAKQLNLDVERFTRSLESGKFDAIIEKEKQSAKEAGVSSTPTFVINGRLSPGFMSFEKMSELIERELEKNY